MSFLPSSPGPTNLPDVFQKYPQRSVLMLRLIDNILRGESPLSVAERELIFAYGSGQNACIRRECLLTTQSGHSRRMRLRTICYLA